MLSVSEQKKCMTCEKVLLGRTDKKFCNDYCRNAYNNQLKATDQAIIRTVNNQLLRNRKLLAQALGDEKMVRITRDKLTLQGFSFKFFTHQLTTKNSSVYHFCYEYGYLALEGEWLLIVKRKEV